MKWPEQVSLFHSTLIYDENNSLKWCTYKGNLDRLCVILIRQTLTQINPEKRCRRSLINFKGIVICHPGHWETFFGSTKTSIAETCLNYNRFNLYYELFNKQLSSSSKKKNKSYWMLRIPILINVFWMWILFLSYFYYWLCKRIVLGLHLSSIASKQSS